LNQAPFHSTFPILVITKIFDLTYVYFTKPTIFMGITVSVKFRIVRKITITIKILIWYEYQLFSEAPYLYIKQAVIKL